MPFEWTEQAVEYLTNNYATQSASQIGKHLGCSKNSAIGKARRLGLASKGSPIIRYEDRANVVANLLRQRYARETVARRLNVPLDFVVQVDVAQEQRRFPQKSPSQPRPQVAKVIKSPAQLALPVAAPSAPLLKPVKVHPVYIGKPRQCEYLHGAEKPWRRCENKAAFRLRPDGTPYLSPYCDECSRRCFLGWRKAA